VRIETVPTTLVDTYGFRCTRPSGRVRIETIERAGQWEIPASCTRPSGRVRIETADEQSMSQSVAQLHPSFGTGED